MTLILAARAATVPDIIVFVVGALLIIGGAFGVVLSRNAVHAALSLVATLFGIAVLFIEQEANFLAAVQVIVYAGAIVVLFLFVIMLLGVDRSDNNSRDRLKFMRPLAVLLGAGVSVLVLVLANWNWKATGQHSVGGASSGGGSDIDKLAGSIFTQYLLPFEATSLLLVIAVVGAVVLARRPSIEDVEEETGEDDDEEVEADAADVVEVPS